MPTDPIRLGTSGALAKANTLEFGPDLWSYGITETGTAAEIEARCATLQAAGWVGVAEPINDGPRYLLRAKYAGSNNPSTPEGIDGAIQTTWDLDVQYADVPPQESEAWTTYRDSIAADADDAAAIDYQMTIADPSDISGFTGWLETRKLWYIAIRQGIPVKEARPVLTKIKVYPHGTSNSVDWVDVGKVWTTAQITGAETVAAKIGTLPTGYWLKCAGQASSGSDGRFTTVTRWIMGHYLSHMYTYKT